MTIPNSLPPLYQLPGGEWVDAAQVSRVIDGSSAIWSWQVHVYIGTNAEPVRVTVGDFKEAVLLRDRIANDINRLRYEGG